MFAQILEIFGVLKNFPNQLSILDRRSELPTFARYKSMWMYNP